MCGPVLAELVAGVPAERRNEYALRLRALPWSGLDRDAWLRAGLVRGDLLRVGFTASLIDIAIAVSAVQANASLWTAAAAVGPAWRAFVVLGAARLSVGRGHRGEWSLPP